MTSGTHDTACQTTSEILSEALAYIATGRGAGAISVLSELPPCDRNLPEALEIASIAESMIADRKVSKAMEPLAPWLVIPD